MQRIIARARSRAQQDNDGFSLMEVVLSISIVLILGVAGVMAYSSITENARQAEKEAGGGTSVTPEPAPAPAPPAEPINWQPLITTLVVVIILGALIAGIVFAVKQFNKYRAITSKTKAELDTKTQRWDTVRERYQKVLSQIATYETDLSLAIRYPAINDPLERPTADMLEVLEEVEVLMAGIPDTGVGGDDELLDALTQKVTKLSTRFAYAENHAKRIALSKMSDTERKDFEQARHLLDQVSDPGNPEKMRVMYAERLKKVVQRINDRHSVPVIPTKTVVELEKSFRLALPTAAAS